ncbi:hypothetical protein [Mycolicibacterium holsaticum]|uniref:Uncharacterized protein n=1 Tax=Mycolicibacterium holsaticum TaxID=152142 RepID=A0A1E3R5W1_9MYCO|nr:hypothetical protein [Mycolicibacterium holsaticum]ODQ85328.1 hypothetical protein BHQ17_23710 [Mycolicibacterium holsaticum]
MTDDALTYEHDGIPADRVFTTGPVQPVLTLMPDASADFLLPAFKIDDERVGTIVVTLGAEELPGIRDFCQMVIDSTDDQRRDWMTQLQQGHSQA